MVWKTIPLWLWPLRIYIASLITGLIESTDASRKNRMLSRHADHNPRSLYLMERRLSGSAWGMGLPSIYFVVRANIQQDNLSGRHAKDENNTILICQPDSMFAAMPAM